MLEVESGVVVVELLVAGALEVGWPVVTVILVVDGVVEEVRCVPDRSTRVVDGWAYSVPTTSLGLLSHKPAAVAAPSSRNASPVRGPLALRMLLLGTSVTVRHSKAASSTL